MNWQGRRVAVTGGAGFIGSHLVHELVRRGADVVVIDNLSTGRESSLVDVMHEVELVRASTLESHRVRRAFRGAQTVFHLAAVLGVKRTWEEPIRVIHENLRGTENVLHAAAAAGASRVVLASSSEVYGDGTPPYSEERTDAAPRTGYAAAKLTEEKLAEAYTSEMGIPTACLRYFNVYGKGQEASAYGFVTAIFCDRVAQGLPPVVFGSGEQTRDFTYVDDVVDATLLAAEKAGAHDVLNVGTGVETSINTLAREVLLAAGRRDLAPARAEARRDEVMRRVADVSKAARVLGWEAHWRLQDGLAATLPRSLDAPQPRASRARR